MEQLELGRLLQGLPPLPAETTVTAIPSKAHTSASAASAELQPDWEVGSVDSSASSTDSMQSFHLLVPQPPTQVNGGDRHRPSSTLNGHHETSAAKRAKPSPFPSLSPPAAPLSSSSTTTTISQQASAFQQTNGFTAPVVLNATSQSSVSPALLFSSSQQNMRQQADGSGLANGRAVAYGHATPINIHSQSAFSPVATGSHPASTSLQLAVPHPGNPPPSPHYQPHPAASTFSPPSITAVVADTLIHQHSNGHSVAHSGSSVPPYHPSAALISPVHPSLLPINRQPLPASTTSHTNGTDPASHLHQPVHTTEDTITCAPTLSDTRTAVSASNHHSNNIPPPSSSTTMLHDAAVALTPLDVNDSNSLHSSSPRLTPSTYSPTAAPLAPSISPTAAAVTHRADPHHAASQSTHQPLTYSTIAPTASIIGSTHVEIVRMMLEHISKHELYDGFDAHFTDGSGQIGVKLSFTCTVDRQQRVSGGHVKAGQQDITDGTLGKRVAIQGST